mgnify:CR=1 FL=1
MKTYKRFEKKNNRHELAMIQHGIAELKCNPDKEEWEDCVMMISDWVDEAIDRCDEMDAEDGVECICKHGSSYIPISCDGRGDNTGDATAPSVDATKPLITRRDNAVEVFFSLLSASSFLCLAVTVASPRMMVVTSILATIFLAVAIGYTIQERNALHSNNE